MRKPDLIVLQEVLDYSPDTGVLTWKVTRGSVVQGSEAGSLDKDGYRWLMYKGKNYFSHRVAWLLYYGYWPTLLDHDNQVKSDNRIHNLRVVSKSENGMNTGPRKNTTTGIKGVSWHTQIDKWRAYITKDYKQIYLGCFDNFFEACCARKSAERVYYADI